MACFLSHSLTLSSVSLHFRSVVQSILGAGERVLPFTLFTIKPVESIIMPETGFEPARSFDQQHLKLLRLPLRHSGHIIASLIFCQVKTLKFDYDNSGKEVSNFLLDYLYCLRFYDQAAKLFSPRTNYLLVHIFHSYMFFVSLEPIF